MAAGIVLTLLVLAKVGFNPVELFDRAAARAPRGDAYLAPGCSTRTRSTRSRSGSRCCSAPPGCRTSSCASSPCPTPEAARGSIGWAVVLIGAFFLMTMLVGVGARAILGAGAVEASAGGNLATPLLAEELGGGEGTPAGTCSSPSSARSRSRRSSRWWPGSSSRHPARSPTTSGRTSSGAARPTSSEEVRVARIAALGLGVLAILVVDPGRPRRSTSRSSSASPSRSRRRANLPALLWRCSGRGSTPPARWPASSAACSSRWSLIVLSPPVWPGPDGEGSPIPLTNPAIVSIPAGFLCCWLGTMLSPERGSRALVPRAARAGRDRARRGVS